MTTNLILCARFTTVKVHKKLWSALEYSLDTNCRDTASAMGVMTLWYKRQSFYCMISFCVCTLNAGPK